MQKALQGKLWWDSILGHLGAQVATEMGNEPLDVLRPLIDVKVCVRACLSERNLPSCCTLILGSQRVIGVDSLPVKT